MMGEYVTNPLAVCIFGLVLTVNTLLFIASYIVRNLIKPELKSAQDPRALVKALVGLIGAAAAWVSVHAALVIYLLTPPFYITPPEWHGRVQPAADEKS
jgi:hypothetical protein